VIREKVKICGIKDDVATVIERQIRGNFTDGIPYPSKKFKPIFDVLLTVHLSIILVINELDAQNLVL